MVLHHTPHHVLPLAGRLGLAAAYAAALVGGTALLMAVLAGQGEPGTDAQGITRADTVMQSAAERALVSPQQAVLAVNGSNERRGI